MNILHVISSPRAASYSHRLSDGIVAKLQAAHPDSTVQVRDLVTHAFPHLKKPPSSRFSRPPKAARPRSARPPATPTKSSPN